MTTLTLQQAAALLKMHPVTLREKASAGEIPGAKVGRRWVFVEIDLLEHIRSQYRPRALQGEPEEISLCHSTNAKTRRIGGSNSLSKDDEYSKVLALPSARRRRNTTTS